MKTNRPFVDVDVDVDAYDGGNNDSLMMIKQLYTNGRALRDDYTRTFKAYQTYLDDIRSDDRDKAASFSHQYRYY